MSKTYFWDEYINYYLDNEVKKDILKFHVQNSSCYMLEESKIPDYIFNDWKKKLKFSYFSDISIEDIEIDVLDRRIQYIYNLLKCHYNNKENIITLPILFISSNIFSLKKGAYSFNFRDNKLVLFKENISIDYKDKVDISIAYFLNIDDAILLQKSKAYLEGILQIGYISGDIENNLNHMLEIKEEFIPSQSFTHKLGINLRKALLIKVQNWKVI